MKKLNRKKRAYHQAGGAVLLLASTPFLFGAQSVIVAPPQQTADTTPAWSDQESTNNEMQVFIPATDVRRPSDEPFKFGGLVIRPHLDYGFTYGTGIQSSTNHSADTIIQTVSPGMSLDLGTHWTVDYTPTLTYYSSTNFSDTLNHSASLTGATEYEDWNLGLSQTFNLTSAPLAETAQQTKTTDYATALTGSYAINDRMSTDLGLNQDFNFVDGQGSSKTWSTMDWLNYSFWKRLTLGVGLGGGFVDIEVPPQSPPQGNQEFEQLQGRVNWRATDKLSFSISAGFEYQEFSATNVSNSLNPIFNASIQYQPFKYTQLSLSAGRSISSSDYFVAASSEINTSVTLTLNQRLLEKFNLNVSAGYNQTDYTDSFHKGGFSLTQDRVDNSYSFNIGLSRSFLKRGNFAVTYSYVDNRSTATGFGYNSNQIGFQVGFHY
jgi:hypothetical protein